MLSTGLILLDEFWKVVAGHFRGDILIALPRKDQLFLFDDSDAAARAIARRLIAATSSTSCRARSTHAATARSSPWRIRHGLRRPTLAR